MYKISKDNFYPNMLKIAIPIFLQSIMAVLLGFIDIIMVTRLSEEALSSVSLANQIFVVLYTFLAGLASGAAIYFARYWGSRQFFKIPIIITVSAIIMLIVGTVVAMISIIYSKELISIMSQDLPKITILGASYLKITAISFPFVALSTIFISYFRSVEKSKYPMFCSFLVIIINTTLNYILIFGKFGFPRLEVDGAAIATVIARITEFIFIFAIFISKKNPIKSNPRDYFDIFGSGKLSAEAIPFLKIALPLCVCDIVWSLGQIAYRYLFSRMGSSVLAATSAVESFYAFFFIFYLSYGIASSAMIGKVIGEHDLVRAKEYSYRFIRLNFVIMLPLGTIFFFIGPLLPSLYNLSLDSSVYFVQCTKVYGLMMAVRSLEFLMMVGILRAGGRTSFIAGLQFVGVWITSIVPAFLAFFIFKAPFYVIYFLLNFDMIFKALVGFYRLYSNKWLKELS